MDVTRELTKLLNRVTTLEFDLDALKKATQPPQAAASDDPELASRVVALEAALAELSEAVRAPADAPGAETQQQHAWPPAPAAPAAPEAAPPPPPPPPPEAPAPEVGAAAEGPRPEATAAAGSPPAVPPPAAAAVDPDEVAKIRARNAQLLADYERIEGEYQALKLRHALGKAADVSAEDLPLRDQYARLLDQFEQLQAEHADLEGRHHEEVRAGKEVSEAAEATRAELAALRKDLEQARAECQALQADYDKLASATPGATELAEMASDDPAKLQAMIQEVVTRNRQLAAQQEHTQGEVERIKHKATRTIKRLQGQANTARLQKDNLLRELASRDSSDGGEQGAPLTLEQITNSPVFKTMLGNIRRTSREEVTLLHDSIVEFGKINPEAYNHLLDVVKATFGAVNVENPLALLRKL